MRIAIVMSHADRNMAGAVRDMILARAFRAAGVDARMFRMHPGREVERETQLDGTVPCIFCPSDNPGEIPHRQVSAALLREMAAFAPDLILYKGLNYAVNAWLQERLDPAPRFGLVVGGNVTDPLLPRAALVLGEYREQLQRCFPQHMAANAAFVLPKYVDLLATEPAWGQAKPEYDIVNVGTFGEKRKNQGDLLPLTARWSVAFVGGGKLLEEAQRSAANPANAHFLGRLPQPEVFGVVKRARIMVHTSTMDGLPRALVEGMACGVPVIAYRDTVYGGLVNGRQGLLIDRKALLPAIELLLTDDGLRNAMGRQARRYVEREHGPLAIERCAQAVLEFLRK